MYRPTTLLLLLSVMSASAVAEEFEFETAPPDVLFAPGEFTMPLPMGGTMFGMPALHGIPGVPFNLIMLAEHLELTGEQREKAGAILDETTPKLRGLMFRMIDARKAGRDLKSGEASDRDLRAHADEQGKIVAELTYLGLKARADLRALLTAEQRRKLDTLTEGRGPFMIRGFAAPGSIDPAHMSPLPAAGVRARKI